MLFWGLNRKKEIELGNINHKLTHFHCVRD